MTIKHIKTKDRDRRTSTYFRFINIIATAIIIAMAVFISVVAVFTNPAALVRTLRILTAIEIAPLLPARIMTTPRDTVD